MEVGGELKGMRLVGCRMEWSGGSHPEGEEGKGTPGEERYWRGDLVSR